MRYFLYLSFFLLVSCSKKTLWEPLYNGTDLSNFEILNGTATFHTEGDLIIGVSTMDSPNTFLATKKIYGDFILEFEVLIDDQLNSGVQFRSISDPTIKDGRVHGYQCEIESSDRKWAGGIYDEGRRGWLYPLKENVKGQQSFKVNEWNHYRIEAIGPHLQTWVNGVQCANLKDAVTAEGIIGLQVHSISNIEQNGRLIKWRNLKIATKNLRKLTWPSSDFAPVIDLRIN